MSNNLIRRKAQQEGKETPMMLCPSQITKLEPGQCICRECGLSQVGIMAIRFRAKDEPYLTCMEDCTYCGSDVPVHVITQEDIESGLGQFGGADWVYVREYFPALAAQAEAAS